MKPGASDEPVGVDRPSAPSGAPAACRPPRSGRRATTTSPACPGRRCRRGWWRRGSAVGHGSDRSSGSRAARACAWRRGFDRSRASDHAVWRCTDLDLPVAALTARRPARIRPRLSRRLLARRATTRTSATGSAIRALLPPKGGRLVEVGAGFGRLADEYAGYGEVVLFDSSDGAARRRPRAPRRPTRGSEFVLGDAHALPFADASFDAVVCVRVAHHFADPGRVFREFARILRPGGILVLEFANKRHLKSIVKYALGRQRWSPFGPSGTSTGRSTSTTAPTRSAACSREAGFRIGPVRAASLFRLGRPEAACPAARAGRHRGPAPGATRPAGAGTVGVSPRPAHDPDRHATDIADSSVRRRGPR